MNRVIYFRDQDMYAKETLTWQDGDSNYVLGDTIALEFSCHSLVQLPRGPQLLGGSKHCEGGSTL